MNVRFYRAAMTICLWVYFVCFFFVYHGNEFSTFMGRRIEWKATHSKTAVGIIKYCKKMRQKRMQWNGSTADFMLLPCPDGHLKNTKPIGKWRTIAENFFFVCLLYFMPFEQRKLVKLENWLNYKKPASCIHQSRGEFWTSRNNGRMGWQFWKN